MYIIGKKYLSQQNEERGLTLMKMAAEKGDGDACLQLGLIYRQAADFENALKWIQKSHEAKKVEGTFYLGSLYHQGHHHPDGTPDIQKASEYYDQAARSGLAIAQYNLGVMYISGVPKRGKLVKNVPMAIEYWKMAAENGVDLACMNLAALFTNGLDQEDALKFIDKDLALSYLDSVRDKKRFQNEIDSLKQRLLL